MRRSLAVLTGLATAGTLVLAVAPAASAASGQLTINHRTIRNPHGCFRGTERPLVVVNHTNRTAVVFAQRDCRGRAIGEVFRNQRKVFRTGESVRIS